MNELNTDCTAGCVQILQIVHIDNFFFSSAADKEFREVTESVGVKVRHFQGNGATR